MDLSKNISGQPGMGARFQKDWCGKLHVHLDVIHQQSVMELNHIMSGKHPSI